MRSEWGAFDRNGVRLFPGPMPTRKDALADSEQDSKKDSQEQSFQANDFKFGKDGGKCKLQEDSQLRCQRQFQSPNLSKVVKQPQNPEEPAVDQELP